MIYITPQGRVEIANTPEIVDLVPSKREAAQALTRLLASLTYAQVEINEQDIETVRKFVWSR